MSIHNVTATTFDHSCSWPGCGKETKAVPYSALEQHHFAGETSLTYTSCERHGPACQRPGLCGTVTGCTVHVEAFTPNLPAAEETSATRSEASREQVRNVRALYQQVGLPVQ